MRFPRLEALFGCRIDEIDEQNLARLVTEQIEEASDLDFKRDVHSSTQDLALDVAAFANQQGGVIVVGIDEDSDGRAGSLTPGHLGEGDELRTRAVVADLVRPFVSVDVRRVESVRDPGRHYLIVAIPASQEAPHFVRKGDAVLKCPCRDGKRTRYLGESEIADRYRARFSAFGDRLERLDEVDGIARTRLEVARAWLSVAVAPLAEGRFRLGGGGAVELGAWIQAVREELPGLGVPPLWQTGLFGRVGPQRFSVRDGMSGRSSNGPALSGLLDLHTDGASVGAMAIGHGDTQTDAEGNSYVDLWDTPMTRDVAAILTVAARHAVENTRTEGGALCRLALVPAAGSHVVFRQTENARRSLIDVGAVSSVVRSDRTIDLGAIYSSATETLSATRFILEDVVQEFGVSEPATVTEDGALVVSKLEDSTQASARAWASRVGVVVL